MSSEKMLLPFIVLYWQPIKFSENILIQKGGEGLGRRLVAAGARPQETSRYRGLKD